VANRRRERAPESPVDWLFGVVQAAADLVPGARVVQRGLESIERIILRELKDRLERLEPAEAETVAPETEETRSPDQRSGTAETPAAVLAELLDRSIDQTPDQARGYAFVTLLRQLVPDEARILGALSDGGAYPTVHITAASTLGSSTRRVLSNVSPVGQAAGVQLREMTPHYLSHLLELGLVELGPEDPQMALKYEILESNSQIREAIAKIERGQKMTRSRIVRRTIRLTELGRALWAACQPPDRATFRTDGSG
jgi:abortive infection alpha-like protein